MFPDEEAGCAHRVGRLWPEGLRCPRCDAEVKRPLSAMPRRWQCREYAPETTYRFSDVVGTIFENTNKPLQEWFRVIRVWLPVIGWPRKSWLHARRFVVCRLAAINP
ncbi:MAG TPA: hypothetical protein VN890_10825 [Methylocella sp.]|nr:hypothetical protein [Methylocella sp.]